jgi:hypothetical protein
MHHGVYKAVNEFILKYNYELIYASDKIYNGSSNKIVWNKETQVDGTDYIAST